MIVIRILSGLVNAYVFIILARIMFSWLPESRHRIGRVKTFLFTITEPYFKVFRRIPFLVTQRVDLAPLLALMVLIALQVTLSEWSRRGAQSLLYLPILLASAILNIFSLFAFLTSVAIGIRLLLVRMGALAPFTAILDRVFSPVIFRLFKLLRIKRAISFNVQCIIFALVMLFIFFGLRFLSAWIFLL